MSIRVWLPLLISYLEAFSKRDADQKLHPVTSTHLLPTEPVITYKLWARLHKFNVNRLLLSQVSGGVGPNKLWEDELEFFLDLYRAYCKMPFS